MINTHKHFVKTINRVHGINFLNIKLIDACNVYVSLNLFYYRYSQQASLEISLSLLSMSMLIRQVYNVARNYLYREILLILIFH